MNDAKEHYKFYDLNLVFFFNNLIPDSEKHRVF
jgi:hypothetical protein